MSDVSVGHSIEYDRCKGNCHSPGEWRRLVSYQVAQYGTGRHFDMTIGLVPTRSDVSACILKHACCIGSSYVSNISADPFLIIG